MTQHPSAIHWRLNRKQVQTLDLLLEEKTSKEIAIALGVAPVTVDARIKKLRELTGARDRSQLISMYRRHLRDHNQTIYGSNIVDIPFDEAINCEAELPESAVFSLKDSATFLPNENRVLPRTALEVLDEKLGRWGRVGLILVFAIGTAMLLLLGLAIATALSQVV